MSDQEAVLEIFRSHGRAKQMATQARWLAHRSDASLRFVFPAFKILAAVARAHGISVKDLSGRSREYKFAKARTHAYALYYELRPDGGMNGIARHLGRDHTTVMSGCNRWHRDYSKNFTKQIALARAELGLPAIAL